jgi:hypothetical protein
MQHCPHEDWYEDKVNPTLDSSAWTTNSNQEACEVCKVRLLYTTENLVEKLSAYYYKQWEKNMMWVNTH